MVFDLNHSQLELMQARIKFVPEGWSFSYVGKAFSIKNNLRKPISAEVREKNPGSYPYYGPTKIQGYIGSFEQDGHYALIGEDGDHFLKYEVLPMTQLVDGQCTVNNHAHIIAGTQKATREWFYYYFMHRDIFSFLSRQGAGRFKLNKASLEKIPVLLPPTLEQKKIAAILSTWDDAITANEDLLANSRLRRKALMQTLLTSQKRLLDKNGKRFEGTWGSKTVGEVGRVVTGSTPPKNNMDNYGGTISWATAEDFIGKYVSDTKLKLSNKGADKARIVPEGSVLVTCIASIGKNAIARENLGTNQQINAVIVNKDNSNEFLYYQIEFNVNSLRALAGTTAVPIINKSSFEKVRLSFTTIEEQCAIAAVLSTADEEIDALEQRVKNLKLQKKALMQQLLTGKKRVKVEPVTA